MFGLCKYKNLIGKPKTGMHSIRIFNIAVLDVVETIIGAYVIYLFFPKYNYFLILLCLFLLGIIAHRIFCVPTTIDKYIFGN
jgi:hypothetical protein